MGRLGAARVVVSTVHAMGNPSSAEAARDAIFNWNPSLIVLTGIAGGFAHQDVNFGDVLVPEQIVGYEHAKVDERGAHTRFEAFWPSRLFFIAAHQKVAIKAG